MWIGEKGPSERGRWEAKRSADRSIGLATSLSRLRRRSPSSLPLPPRASELPVPPPFPHLDPVKALENGYSCSRERARKRENRKSCETGGRKELKKKNPASLDERARARQLAPENVRRSDLRPRPFLSSSPSPPSSSLFFLFLFPISIQGGTKRQGNFLQRKTYTKAERQDNEIGTAEKKGK